MARKRSTTKKSGRTTRQALYCVRSSVAVYYVVAFSMEAAIERFRHQIHKDYSEATRDPTEVSLVAEEILVE